MRPLRFALRRDEIDEVQGQNVGFRVRLLASNATVYESQRSSMQGEEHKAHQELVSLDHVDDVQFQKHESFAEGFQKEKRQQELVATRRARLFHETIGAPPHTTE